MARREYQGILFIGDPHLASHNPGFRKDDYPRTALAKLQWSLDYAGREHLLPAILGDLFHRPRDNANWLIGDLLAMLARQEVLAIWGNHDCQRDDLEDDDSFSILLKAGALRLVTCQRPWVGCMNGRSVVIVGTPWGDRPEKVVSIAAVAEGDGNGAAPLVFSMMHHDITVPGYEGRMPPREIQGVDVVINGHIHRPLPDVAQGATLWLTPGNISRVSRSDASREQRPSVLEARIGPQGWSRRTVEVPHEPFDVVFHEEVVAEEVQAGESAFIQGLAELAARRTDSGAGLEAFLEKNLGRFDPDVATQVRALAKEVIEDEQRQAAGAGGL